MGPIFIERNTDNLKPTLKFGRREWLFTYRVTMVVLLIFLIGQLISKQDDSNAIVLHHGAVHYEHLCIDDYCGPRPAMPGEVPVTFKTNMPTDLRFIAVDGRLWATVNTTKTELSWVVGRTSEITLWVPETWLQANVEVCGPPAMMSCVELVSGQLDYVLPSGD